MHSALRIVVSVVVISTALATYHSSTKLRRDGVLNLYPFPRVGRASRHTWQVPLNDFYLEYEPLEKRQLYAFPRVGRSDVTLSREVDPIPAQHSSNAEGPGMWFGPRIGRSFKNNEDEYGPLEKRQLYAFPRVGRSDVTLSREVDPIPAQHSSNADSPGMWFGPRLGRSFKNNDDDITIKNENIDRSEPEQIEERKKRQTN